MQKQYLSLDSNNVMGVFSPKTGQSNDENLKWEIKSLGGDIIDVKYEIERGVYENKSRGLVFEDEYFNEDSNPISHKFAIQFSFNN